MLGEKLGEATGRTTGTRLLPFEWDAPRVEKSFDGRGEFLGRAMTLVGSYWESFREGGAKFGEGRMLLQMADGEIAYFRANGVARAPDRYAAFGDFPWTTAGVAQLKGMGAVLEYDLGPDGAFGWRMWEWR
jgi:hypothetical protein